VCVVCVVCVCGVCVCLCVCVCVVCVCVCVCVCGCHAAAFKLAASLTSVFNCTPSSRDQLYIHSRVETTHQKTRTDPTFMHRAGFEHAISVFDGTVYFLLLLDSKVVF